MKLVSISFNALPRMPGMRPGDLITIECVKPGEALRDWHISIRGQQVFLVSPAGWSRDRTSARDPKGTVVVFEVPRADVTFQWQGSADEVEAILKSGKYDSEPLGWQ